MRSWDSIFKVIRLGLFCWVVGVFWEMVWFCFVFVFLKHDLKIFFFLPVLTKVIFTST